MRRQQQYGVLQPKPTRIQFSAWEPSRTDSSLADVGSICTWSEKWVSPVSRCLFVSCSSRGVYIKVVMANHKRRATFQWRFNLFECKCVFSTSTTKPDRSGL